MFEVSLTDLQNESDSERAFRKFKLISEDVQVRLEKFLQKSVHSFFFSELRHLYILNYV